MYVLKEMLITFSFFHFSVLSGGNYVPILYEENQESYVTPEMYGAKGDDFIDDTEAIQNAINNDSGAIVVFSNKTYILSNTIKLKKKSRIIGNKTILLNINSENNSVLVASNSDSITIDGFVINFGAEKFVESGGQMFRDGIISLIGDIGCHHSSIRNCIIYGLKKNQSGIVIRGDYIEVSHCEVFSGSGNRKNSGIVCGTYDHSSPNSVRNGGCNYASVHDCYVHDISVGDTPDESGYGIYLIACNYSSVYNCRVENCNWVCINSQTEKGLPSGGHNMIYNNITKLDSKMVFPRHDYIGPYNIYLEASPSSVVSGNKIVCGKVSSNRYIPLQVAKGSKDCVIRNNKFIASGLQNTYALVGIDDQTVYDNNECDFTPPT